MTDGRIDGLLVGWMDKRTDGRRWMVGQTDECIDE